MPSSLIIGAGMAGLAAARKLSTQGWDVVVLDKGRGVGGRLATRRIEQAKADHGAQYFSATTPELQELVQELLADKVITEWKPTQPSPADTVFKKPHYVGVEGMNAVAKALSKDLTVRTAETVISFRVEENQWLVETESGGQYRADALLITIPAPQALALIEKSGFPIVSADKSVLSAIRYQPCIAVMVALNKPSLLPAPGAVRYETSDIAWVADNAQKGISPGQPSVTIHASADFSRTHFDGDLNAIGQQLVDQLPDLIPADNISTVQVHRWRYSLTDQRHPAPFLKAEAPLSLLFGGDGFGKGNVEGAFTSGLAMAGCTANL
ncbi:NAD(P)/FAD-dependent oxidoreductase [Spirosoma linguale]|uniref:FAD dependent oxidoreductase n=1 Tax=Spirosoma linguale (strain ATCC 33905 / DSM 74 / LMG 10896 / Claus 1) TaxID=504472 RepID=D2QPL0_SPILD|nr:FAD dependent oxidoreductase [Spirosoma linguale DSM 74]